MSAVSSPSGFNPVYHPSGEIVANLYEPTVANGPTAAIYKGDPVKLTGTTDVVNIAAANDAILGVFVGCEYVDVDGKPVYKPYWPGTTTGATGIKFWVLDDPAIMYEIQSVGSEANTAIAASADFVIAAGSTYTGVTGTYLAASAGAVSNNVRIMGLGRQVSNAWGDAYTVLRVQILKSQLISTPAGIA